MRVPSNLDDELTAEAAEVLQGILAESPALNAIDLGDIAPSPVFEAE
jgi:hypothetical protein